jgi:hypothetical protein
VRARPSLAGRHRDACALRVLRGFYPIRVADTDIRRCERHARRGTLCPPLLRVVGIRIADLGRRRRRAEHHALAPRTTHQRHPAWSQSSLHFDSDLVLDDARRVRSHCVGTSDGAHGNVAAHVTACVCRASCPRCVVACRWRCTTGIRHTTDRAVKNLRFVHSAVLLLNFREVSDFHFCSIGVAT